MAKQEKPSEIVTRLLPVKLTRDEVFIRGKELATKQQERSQKERELNSVIQSAKGAKETLQEEIVATRGITDAERQRSLFKGPKPAPEQPGA